MARPTDWSKLGLDHDPTPGSQDTMAALAKIMDTVQGQVDEMESTITAIVNNVAGGWTGKTADALRGQISDQLQKFFRGLQQCFDEAAPAIHTFITAMAQHQADADTALTKALGLPDKDPGLAQYKQAATQAGSDLTAAGNTASSAIDDAVSRLASALTPSEIFWEAFQWLALILGVVGLIFGGPLAILAWLANIALFIKTIVDFAHGDTNFLGLFLSFLGIIAPMTRGIGGDLANLIKGGFGKIINGVDKFGGTIGNLFTDVKTLFIDFSTIGVLGSIKVIGQLGMKAGLWVFDKILTFPNVITKIGALAFDKFMNFDQYLFSGIKFLGDSFGKGIDFVLTEIGTGRFVRLFLPVTKDEFTALNFSGALWRSFERTLPGIVPMNKVLDDQFTLFQLTKSLNLPADAIAKMTLNLKTMHDFNPEHGINYVPMPNGTLFVPEKFLSTIKLNDINTIDSLVKPNLLDPHFNASNLDNLGKIDPHFDIGNLDNLGTFNKIGSGNLSTVTIHGLEQLDGFKPIEITNLAHADSIAVVKIGDSISLTGVEKEIAVAKLPTFTGADHIATVDVHEVVPHVEISAAATAEAVPIHDVLSLVKNVEVTGGNLAEHNLADIGSLNTSIDHSLAGQAGALHGLGSENIAVRAEPIANLHDVAGVGGLTADHLAVAKQAFDHQITAFAGKISPDVLDKMGTDFLTQIKDVHSGWRDPRLVDHRFSELQVNRLIDNLPKQFTKEFERAGWIDDLGKGIKDDPSYVKLSLDAKARFDQEITTRVGSGFDRVWSAKNAAFGDGTDLPALKLALAADLKTALGKALERDDWMRKAGAAFEHGLGENAGIAGKLPPAELAKFRQEFLGTAEKIFQDAQANKLTFTADIQDGLAGALTHDMHSKLADQIARISKVNSNGLKGLAIASDWAAKNPNEAALVGDSGIQRLLHDLSGDLRKIPPGSRPQIFNQALKNFEGKLAFEADLRTALADAAHAFHGAPEDAAKFRENTVLDFLSGHSLPNGMPHGITPDLGKSWLSWEKDNGDVFGSTLSQIHPVDKTAAWSQARIDLAKGVQPKIQFEKQIAPKITTALDHFDTKLDKWSEDHGSVSIENIKAWRDEFDKALRDAGPAVLNDPPAFDRLTKNLLDGLDHRLGSEPEVAALKNQADIRFQDAIKDWAGKTGGTPSFFGFTKLTEDFQAHIGDLLGAARHGLGDGGGLDVAKFAKGLDDHLASIGAKLDKEAGLGHLEADAFEKAYGGWLGHDVPLADGFSADRLTDLASEFRSISRTLTDHLGADEAKPIIDDLASRLPERFDLELRSLSRIDAADDAFTHGLQDWHNPAGMRDLTAPEIGAVRTEFTADAKELTKVPDTFWTGARLDAKQIRALIAGWDSRLGDLASAVPGRLNFEAHLLDELSHASELLGDGAKYDHIVQDFRQDFTHEFHDVWGNGRNADDWLAKEQRNGDVFTNGPGVQMPKTSLELRPLDSHPVAPDPRPQNVAGTWGRPVNLSTWDKAWHHEVDGMFSGNGILSLGTVKDGVATGGNKAITRMFNDAKFGDAAKVQLQTDLDALHKSLADPEVSSAAARPLLQNLFDHNLKGDTRASKFPVSAMNDALESLNAKLLAEVHGGSSGLHPWPFDGSAKKPDYVLAGPDGKVPKPGENGFGGTEDTFFNSVTHVGDHLRYNSVKEFADVGKGVRSAVDSKLKAYGDKQVRVVVDLTKAPGLEAGPGRDLTALIGHVTDAYRGGGWDGPTRLIQSDLIVPGHFLGQPDPAVLTFRFRSDGLVYLDGAGAGWGHAGELGDHAPADAHPAVEVPSLDGGIFQHPDLPGGGRILPGGLLLSNQAKDLALAAKLPKYDGAFLLVTHFDDVRGQAHVNDVPVPHGLVGGYFKSGLLPWRDGQLIVVVGCGAEDLAAALRTELHTPTVGETHDFVTTHDGFTYTGPESWSEHGPDVRTSQLDWRPTPDVLEAGPHDDGGARFKLFLPGDLEIEPYHLGSDFGQSMRRLGFDPSSSVSNLDYLGKLAKFDDGPLAVKAGLQAFADKVFAAHLPPTESLKTALTDLGHPTEIGVDWKSGGVPIDQDLRTYLQDLTDLEAKSPDAARDWRLTGLKQDPDLGPAFKDHLFPEDVPPQRLYVGHSDVGPDGSPVAGHDFVDVISRIERGTTPSVDIVHVGPGYIDHWTATLSDGRGVDELKTKFGAAGASEIEVVRFDDLGKPGSKLGTLSTGVGDGVHIRLTLVGEAATFKPLLKAGEPLVLVAGGKSAADALSAGKALLYQGADHVGVAGEAQFLDQLAHWGTAIGGKYSPMTNMLYAFGKQDLFKDTSDPARLRIVADLAKNDLHLAPWREFSDLMAVGHDANVAQLGQFSRKIWEQGAAGVEIKDAVKTLTELTSPTLKDLDAFEKRISGLVGTTGKWSADAGQDIDDLIRRMHDLSLDDADIEMHDPVAADVHTDIQAHSHTDIEVHTPMEVEHTPTGAYVHDNKFFHPDLPGHGYVLNDSLLLSNRPADLRLSDGVPRYDGVFRLMTHFEKPTDELFVNGVRIPAELAHDFLTSGVTDWRPGMPILVVGCGAEGVADLLRTRLQVATVGATHDVVALNDHALFTFTGDIGAGAGKNVVDDPLSGHDFWTDPPKDLTGAPVADGKSSFKLFLPGDAEHGISYPLGSDLVRAMNLLGLRRTDMPALEKLDLDMIDANGSSWAHDLHLQVGGRDYRVTVRDDELNPTLQNPWLIIPNLDHDLHLQVGHNDGAGTPLGQFCGYLSVHWLTQADHSIPLGFKDLGGLRDDAVRTVTGWMTGAHGPDGIAAIDSHAVQALSGDRPAVQLGLTDFAHQLADLPGGTRIVFSTNGRAVDDGFQVLGGHSMAAVLEDGGGVRVFDPDQGHGLIHFPDRQSFLADPFTQRATTFVIDDRVVTPPPPPHLPAPPSTSLAHTPPDTTVVKVFDVDPLTHNPWATPDPETVVAKFTAFVDAVRDIRPPHPVNPWRQITVLGRDGKPTGEVYAVDDLNGRWAKLGVADSVDARHLWDGSRGPYLGKGGVTVRPNGDVVLVGEDKTPFYLKENLGDGRYVEVFRALDGKRHWFEWKGDGPDRELLFSGKRIYETNADGAVFKDLYRNGRIARDYRVTLDKGLIRAERGLGDQRGLWVWNRYDKDGNSVAKGIREYQGSAWKDTLTFGEAGAKAEVVVAKQWSMWFTKWGHAGHFREHTIDIRDGKLGDPLKTLHTYKEISPQDKETGTSEFIGENRILVIQRVAEQRIPTWFARHFAEIDVPNRGLFGGVSGVDSRFQIYAWSEHEIVPGGKPLGAPIQRAGGMRVAIPDGSTFDFVTVTAAGGKDTGVLVRAVVKLDDGSKLEVGRDLDSGKWASLAGGVTAVDGRTLNWRQVGSDKKVISQGVRTFGPGHQWTDTLDDEAKTIVRSTDDLGRVTSDLGRDTSLTRDPIGLITKRTDSFPGVGGKGEIVAGSGNPLSGKWSWEVTGADGAVISGLRFPFRSHPDLGSWDDSFVDFHKIDGISKVVPIREIRALDKGRGLAAYKIGDVWHSDIRGLDGSVKADTHAIRQWKADDGTWGPNPKPGTDMQPWRDVPESAHGNFIDPPVLRTVVDGKVRLYDIKDGTPNSNVWSEFDHGGGFRAKELVGVTPGGKEIYRETHAATGQWIETLADGTRIRYRSLNGFINTRDTFGRWSVRPDFDISGRWKTGGREYEFRGAGTEFRGYNRMWREPNRLQYRDIDGVDGQFVNPNWLKAQKVLLDFLQDYTFDVIANILITGAVNNWNFTPADWGKIFAGGAVTSGVKGASNALQETLLKKFKDGVGNVDSGKFWGRAPYNHDKTWDNEWAGNENPRRWRSGLYDYGVNSLLTSGIAGFVSTAFTSTVFGIGTHHITVSGLESLQAGGLGMAGALTGGLLAVGPRTILHQLGSGRYFHQGGIPDLLISFGEKTFEKWFIGDVLSPALNLKITPPPPILGTGQGPWNG
ncbi:WXG100 family type VII secretion target [Catenulispora rubra]|uniref:WXG100 family type VII secretion target n=1 Tax=Catenulispora rubra TaxID=280293 RepID=UPI0018921044|nr:WXG100 family type VII secretion target [Catenulispora rubra]